MASSTRFRRTASLLVSGLTVLAGAQAQAAVHTDISDATRGSCLVLEWMDPHELLPTGERWMAKETTRILEAADIAARWDWSSSDENRETHASNNPEHRLRVVLLPSDPSGPGWGLSVNTLGTTVMNGVSAPPAVYIFYRSVASLLGRNAHPNSVSEPHVLGPATRAFGRVVAHEIAHAIAPTEPHASSGLMQAGLDPSLLTARNDVAIDAHWERILGEGLSELCSAR
jgi:hypothetical protein